MDLINPYMRHHSFTAAAAMASQNVAPAVNLLNRSPPLTHHLHHQHHHPHANHMANGFPDPTQMDYQNLAATREQLLDYHNAAAAAAYAANNNNNNNSNNNHNNNNNNNHHQPLMLLKANLNNDKLAGAEPKSPRSIDESSSTPPPLHHSAAADNHNNHSALSQSSSRLQSESPDDNCSSMHHKSRYDNNSSPGADSAKSFSISQRSSDEGDMANMGGNTSESSPPPADYAPENLSNRKFSHNNNNNNNCNSNNNNLMDHKLPLSFLGPPLAALHSMTEMKSSSGMNQNSNGSSYGSPTQLAENHRINASVSGSCTTNTQTQGVGNPHGIDTILSKPPPVTSAGLSALAGGNIPRFSIAAAAAGMAQYLSQNQGTPLKTHSGHMVDRTHLYWPGLQGLVANPMAWRERLSTTMSANLSQAHHQHHSQNDKDGKKKHTRPTFSGQQIFALEKTFEQTKYLAGPERAKLAYALGMTESQVKVWFQNRRTKWRKRHAAEMATAKRKQDDMGGGGGGDPGDDCSEPMDSDEESLDIGESPAQRKRNRMEDNYRH